MNKNYQKSFSDDKIGGFTLIELLVVVLIVCILAAIALPQYEKAVARSRLSQLMITAKNIYDAQQAYYLANGQYASKLEELDIGFANFVDNKAQSIKFEFGSCAINYDTEETPDRVGCLMEKPRIFYAIRLLTNRRTCCAYSQDNYAGESVCQSLFFGAEMHNGCSESSPCHCYSSSSL